MRTAATGPMVTVRMVVNVGRLRRGMYFNTALTPRVEQLATIGYLRILGHVGQKPVSPQPAPDMEEVAGGGVADPHR